MEEGVKVGGFTMAGIIIERLNSPVGFLF